MSKEIGIRLKQLRRTQDLTQAEAAQLIGVSQQAWQSAESGRSLLATKRLEIVAKEFNTDINWIVTGKGNDKKETQILIDTENGKLVKLISGKVLAGLTQGFQPDEGTIQDMVYIPGVKSKKDCYAIEVSGQSMEPEIKEGAIIIVEPIEDRSEFRDNRNYVIIAEGIPFLKKASMILTGKDRGKFELSSLNEQGTKLIAADEITSMYRVIYVINPM